MSELEASELIKAVPAIGFIFEQMKQEMHTMRIKNMDLRSKHSKVLGKVSAQAKYIGELEQKVNELQVKSEHECSQIVKLAKENEALDEQRKKLRKEVSRVQKKIAEAEGLFDATLDRKL